MSVQQETRQWSQSLAVSIAWRPVPEFASLEFGNNSQTCQNTGTFDCFKAFWNNTTQSALKGSPAVLWSVQFPITICSLFAECALIGQWCWRFFNDAPAARQVVAHHAVPFSIDHRCTIRSNVRLWLLPSHRVSQPEQHLWIGCLSSPDQQLPPHG